VAAVHSGQRGRGNGRGCSSRPRGGNRPPRSAQPQQSAANSLMPGQGAAQVTPAALARASLGLCHPHWTYGEGAFQCDPPPAVRETNSPGAFEPVVPGPLVHVTDQVSGRRIFVDTGAAFSIFPHQSTAMPYGPLLSGPAGRNIPCWSERRLVLSLSSQKFQWTFLLAAIQFLILGINFLRQFGLLVDPAAGSLIFPEAGRFSEHSHCQEAMYLSSPVFFLAYLGCRHRKSTPRVGGGGLTGCHLRPVIGVPAPHPTVPSSGEPVEGFAGGDTWGPTSHCPQRPPSFL
jgi:hypothetical protein